MNRGDWIVLGVLAAAGAAWWLVSPDGQAGLGQARAWWRSQQLPVIDPDLVGPFDPRAELDPDAPGAEPLPAPVPDAHDR